VTMIQRSGVACAAYSPFKKGIDAVFDDLVEASVAYDPQDAHVLFSVPASQKTPIISNGA
jgi:hypothetical protein